MGVSFAQRVLDRIGNRLREHRNSRNEKQINVTRATGISAPVLSKIENGKHHHVTLETLLKLAEYYHTTLDELLH